MPNSTLLRNLPTETADEDTIIAIDTNQDGVLGKTELQNVDLSIFNNDTGFISAVQDDASPVLSANLDASSNKITNVATPTNNQDAATKQYVDDTGAAGVVPIGGVVPWLKSFSNTPALPDNYVECNGQTISDSESPYDGQTIPNLNGNNNFLRGNSTSGGTGGSAAHDHDVSITYDNGDNGLGWESRSTSSFGNSKAFVTDNDFQRIEDSGTNISEDEAAYTDSSNNEPPYYDTVMVMRIK